MKLSRKNVSLTSMATEAETALREIFITQPKTWIQEIRERFRDLPKANFELGLRFAEEGKWYDAAFRFRMALRLKADYPRAAYNLGCCYVRMGKLPEAKAALLRARELTPGNPDVIFMLATLDPGLLASGQRPTRMPPALVTGFYSSVANGYDIAEAKANYQAGNAIYELASPFLKNPAPAVLDLGCGSGIAARPWRATASSIHGVDITPAMLALAERAMHAEKKLYDTLITADVSDLATAQTGMVVDLVLLVNVAQFIGDLSPVLHGVEKMLTPEGIAVLTVEPYASSGEFGLNAETSRFGHSPDYVRKAASAAGLQVLKQARVELYAGMPVEAFVLGKDRR